MIGLDSYSRQGLNYLDPILIYISLWIDCLFENPKLQYVSSVFRCQVITGSMMSFFSPNYVSWPIFFLMNVFIALKGTHFWFWFSRLMECRRRTAIFDYDTPWITFHWFLRHFEKTLSAELNSLWITGKLKKTSGFNTRLVLWSSNGDNKWRQSLRKFLIKSACAIYCDVFAKKNKKTITKKQNKQKQQQQQKTANNNKKQTNKKTNKQTNKTTTTTTTTKKTKQQQKTKYKTKQPLCTLSTRHILRMTEAHSYYCLK